MKMTLVGAGVRTPYVLHGLANRERDLGLTEVVLHDADRERVELMAALGAHLCREWGATFAVRGEPDPRAALSGSRFVFTAIRVGQERARALDEEIPLRYGVLGQETTGPGGFAMALRTIPAMLDIAHLIAEVAPDALIVNFTNPVGIVTQALCDLTPVPAVGVCDGPVSMKASVAEFLGVTEDDVHADYFGLNHAGWIHRVLVDGQDRLPEILDRYEELQSTEDSWRLFDPELVRTLGMLPMEYLYFYYYRRQAVEHVLSSGGTRAAQIAALNASLWPVLRERVDAGDLAGARDAWGRAMDARGATYFARERGEAVSTEPSAGASAEPEQELEMFEGDGYEGMAIAVMTAAIRRRKAHLIVNVPNRGAIPGLLDTDVVEVTCSADEGGARSLAQGPMPDVALGLVQRIKAFERLTVDAAVEGSRDAALRALLVHPLVGTYPLARSILDDYLSAHAAFLPRFA
jgi:6-phospho-beta-glucosidase